MKVRQWKPCQVSNIELIHIWLSNILEDDFPIVHSSIILAKMSLLLLKLSIFKIEGPKREDTQMAIKGY